MMGHVLGFMPPLCGKLGCSSWLLILGWSSCDCYGHSVPWMEDSLCICLRLCLSNKQINYNEKKLRKPGVFSQCTFHARFADPSPFPYTCTQWIVTGISCNHLSLSSSPQTHQKASFPSAYNSMLEMMWAIIKKNFNLPSGFVFLNFWNISLLHASFFFF